VTLANEETPTVVSTNLPPPSTGVLNNMKYTIQDRILQRELGGTTRYSSIKGLYGDRTWVKNLDILNELEGHAGCVNALRYAISDNAIRQMQTE
jgi:hypothetical protein